MNRKVALVEITNFLQIAYTYGLSVSSNFELRFVGEIHEVWPNAVVNNFGNGCMKIHWPQSEQCSIQERPTRSAYLERIMQVTCAKSGIGAVNFPLLGIKMQWVKNEGARLSIGSELSMQFHADTEIAAIVDHAMTRSQVQMVFQPIYDSNDFSAPVYYECLARIFSPIGQLVPLDKVFPALERLGIMCYFDVYMVQRVIEVLKQNPQLRLAVNVSASSAKESARWDSVFDALASRTDVCGRFLVEITEGAPIASGIGHTFAARLRSLGCKIAIDDYGAGYSAEIAREIGFVDVVKIDRSFIKKASQFSESGMDELAAILEQAKYIGQSIVVEGIEGHSDVLLACRAGVKWLQGFYFGMPSEFSAVSHGARMRSVV